MTEWPFWMGAAWGGGAGGSSCDVDAAVDAILKKDWMQRCDGWKKGESGRKVRRCFESAELMRRSRKKSLYAKRVSHSPRHEAPLQNFLTRSSIKLTIDREPVTTTKAKIPSPRPQCDKREASYTTINQSWPRAFSSFSRNKSACFCSNTSIGLKPHRLVTASAM